MCFTYHVGVNGLLGHLGRGTEQRTHIHVVAQITEATRNYLQ